MNAVVRLAYWAYFTSPKEYGHLFYNMSAEEVEQVITFIQRYSTAKTTSFEDLAAFVMSILFSLNINE
jgi:hypothetical protein